MVEKHTNDTIDDSGTFSGSDDGSGSEVIKVIAGFSAGDYYYNIPGSATADTINIAKTSNIGIPGIWILNSASMLIIIRLHNKSFPHYQLCYVRCISC